MTVQERQALVRDFHRKMNEPISDAPEPPDKAQAVLRAKLIIEEALELAAALGVTVHMPVNSASPGIFEGDVSMDRLEFFSTGQPNIVEAVDALRDLEYLIHGTELVLGVTEVTDETFLEVHRSNLDKEPVHYGEKAIKPVGWRLPDIAGALRKKYPKKALLFRR